jgi:UDP-2,3-diacylglucosamine pyrophosphatase LpxH
MGVSLDRLGGSLQLHPLSRLHVVGLKMVLEGHHHRECLHCNPLTPILRIVEKQFVIPTF